MTDPISILHVNTHDVAGGAAKVASRLGTWQRKRGHRSRLLAGHKLDETGSHSLAFDVLRDPALEAACAERGELFYDVRGSHLLGPAVEAHDVLHLHNLHGGYFNPFSLPLLAGLRPTVWTLHDMQALTGHCAHSFACDRWEHGCGACPHLEIEPALRVDRTAELWREKREIYLRSRVHLVVPSRWLLDKVARSPLQHLPVELIHNGVDTEVFTPRPRAEARQRLGLPADAILVGTVAQGGVTNHWKGWPESEAVLREVLSRDPRVHFVSVGGGDATLERFHGLGHVDDENELAWAYSALDLFLYTPKADNCPLVVLEALACGIPLATFGTGGVPELVRHGMDGLVVDPDDTASLTQSVLRLVADAPLREMLAQQARLGAAQRFSMDQVTSRYDAVYETACRQFEHRPRPSRAELIDMAPPSVRTPEYLAGIEHLCGRSTPAAGIPG